ncbi:hypothetical protein AB0M43_22090 [Longispora sp. NPDC051575]|uniref:TRAFAC clade GTPase domain-containing protein n=1 Tax=Longispora sp. NPDC051575 TaxID=3154943 RepID=UPI003424A6D6
MPAIVVIVVGGLALVVYAWACLLALVWVAFPGSYLLGVAGLLLGAGLAVVLAGRVFLGHGPRPGSPVVVAPASTGDPGWPGYFTAQVYRDLRASAAWTARLVYRAWAVAIDQSFGRFGAHTLWAWPLLLPLLVLLFAVTAGATAGALFATALTALVTVLAVGGGLATALVLRAADRLWQRVFHAAASCPRPGCYHVTRLPAYRCPGCDRLHRDLRPGRLGVLWRHCGCGATLPTTVLRAGRALETVCQKCESALHSDAALATDVRIPVFGAPMAGKTRFIMAGLVGLSARPGIRIAPADPESGRAFAEYEATIGGGDSTAQTGKALPSAVTLRVAGGRRTALLHVFDAAGERFTERSQNEELAYLDHARGLVFVLDPFSIPEVRARLRGLAGPGGVPVGAALYDPDESYQVTVRRLRDYGVDLRRQRLAFVVSKADLLLAGPAGADLALPGPPPPGRSPGGGAGRSRAGDPVSAAIRSWLDDAGLDNLLLAAGRDFAEVRYFLVSSMTADPNGDVAATAPLDWLLSAEPVPTGAAP